MKKSTSINAIISFAIILFTMIPLHLSGKKLREISQVEQQLVLDLLDETIAFENVATVELNDENQYSTTYLITTHSGDKVWQVVSRAALRALPNAAQLVCIAAIKNPVACRTVYTLSKTVIRLYRTGETFAALGEFWKTKLNGTYGIASLTAKSESEAKDGQMAFLASATQTKFPWENASIVLHKNNTDRLDGSSSTGSNSDLFKPKSGLDYTKRRKNFFNFLQATENIFLPAKIFLSLTKAFEQISKLSFNFNLHSPYKISNNRIQKADPVLINNIILEFKGAIGTRASKVYSREDINDDSKLEAELRTKYRISNDFIIVGAYNDISWYNVAFKRFDEGIVFTDSGLFTRVNESRIGYIPWVHINKKCNITWGDKHVFISEKSGNKKKQWSIEVVDSELESVELAKLIDDVAYAVSN